MKLKGNAYKPITSNNQVKFARHNPESRTARRLKVTLLQLVFESRRRVMISAIWNLYFAHSNLTHNLLEYSLIS